MDRIRELAARALASCDRDDAWADVQLTRAIRENDLTDTDRRFLTRLVFGAAKAEGTLDWMIGRYSNRPVIKMTPNIRAILRLGFFQLFYLDKVPASAAINESVNLAKKYGHGGVAKFVNAVLRTAAREPDRAKFPESNQAENLALSSFHPLWLVKRWIDEFGYEETKALCEKNNESAPLSMRTNTLKTERDPLLSRLADEGCEVLPSSWAPEGIIINSHGALDSLPSLRIGLMQAQDESSMLVAHVAAPEPGEIIIDACCAPGGKTTHMAALMKNHGRIIAFDIHDKKLETVRENAHRLGIDIIETKCADAREIGRKYKEMADRVLVDAPCSGLGVLRRRPDARWRKSPESIREISALQREILKGAAGAVKPGGVIVYSTCTITREENDDAVSDFLNSHSDFSLEETGMFLPLKKRAGKTVLLLPQRDGTDGFFIARMKRAC